MTDTFTGTELAAVTLMLERVLGDVMHHNVPNHLQYDADNARFVFSVEGFYKHGAVKLWSEGDRIMLKDRYNSPKEIYDAYDLANFNFGEWLSYKDRSDGWSNPDSNWVDILIKHNLIKVEKKTVTTYSVKR